MLTGVFVMRCFLVLNVIVFRVGVDLFVRLVSVYSSMCGGFSLVCEGF